MQISKYILQDKDNDYMMALNNIRLKTKMLCGFIAVATLTVIMGVAGYAYIDSKETVAPKVKNTKPDQVIPPEGGDFKEF